MKYFNCRHCNKQLINLNIYKDNDNMNEFWCDACGKTYTVFGSTVYEEDDV